MDNTMAIVEQNGGVGAGAAFPDSGEQKPGPTVQRWTWRQWLRPMFVMIYLIFCCLMVPLLIWDMYTNEQYFDAYSWLTSGICALFAIGVSIYGILCHIVYFSRPNQQRYILRILLMVPIYSIDSSIALRVPKAAIFLDSIRACYQAFVVYCFLFYLLHYLYENYDLDTHLAAKPQMKSPKPFCCFKPGPNSKLVMRSRNGVLNFVIIGPLTTIISLFFYYLSDKYEEGTFTVRGAWLWLNVISAVSQIWAMYCLAIFYQATKEETAPLRPLPQMLCVKFAVFGSFFQQFIIDLLVDSEVFESPAEWEYSKNEFSSEIHNCLVCIEMAIVSVIHLYAFTHIPYKSDEPLPFRVSCRGLCDYSDMTTNIKAHSRRVFKSIRHRGKDEDTDKEEIIKEGDMVMSDRDPEDDYSTVDLTVPTPSNDISDRPTDNYQLGAAPYETSDQVATEHGNLNVHSDQKKLDSTAQNNQLFSEDGLFGINAGGNLNNVTTDFDDTFVHSVTTLGVPDPPAMTNVYGLADASDAEC